MKMKCYLIWDSKAKVYRYGSLRENAGFAIRDLTTVVNDKQNQTEISRYPGDFTLFEVGEYDDTTGITSNYASFINLGCLISFVENSVPEEKGTHKSVGMTKEMV